MSNERKTGNSSALLPLGVFLVLFNWIFILSNINVCMWYICYRN